jgi:hypothetical protein
VTLTGNPNRFLALQWLRAVTDAAGLDDGADRPGISAIVTVAVVRTFYADNDGTRCFPSQRTLAETGGMCHKTVSAVDDWLLETGFMAYVMKRKDGQNSYRLTFPSGESDGNEKRFSDDDRGRTPATARPERGRTPAADSETGVEEKRFSDDDRGRTPAKRGRGAGVRPTTFPVSSFSDDDDDSGSSLRSSPQSQSTSVSFARFEFMLRALDDALEAIYTDDSDDDDDALDAAYEHCSKPFVKFCQTYPSGNGEYAGIEQIVARVAALDGRSQREHLEHLVSVDRQCRQRLSKITTTNPAKKENT